MKKQTLAKIAKIAKINPADTDAIYEYLSDVMGSLNVPDNVWDTASDEYKLMLCEQYEEEYFD